MKYQLKTTAQSVITLYVNPETTCNNMPPEQKRGIPLKVLQHVSELAQAFTQGWMHTSELQAGTASQQHQLPFYPAVQALIGIVPANHTISFEYDSTRASGGELKQAIMAGVKQVNEHLVALGSETTNKPATNYKPVSAPKVCLPVYYGEEVAWDLPELSRLSGLSRQEIIHRHQSGSYCVSAVGFSPGFAYMQGLAESLQFPRLTHPRRQVPAGALAVAEHQTAVYPQASPAGWRIIGHCPVPLFTIHDPGTTQQSDVRFKECEALLSMGDVVSFQALDKQAYFELLYENRRYFTASLSDIFPKILGGD